jgi:hypothetical protein
VAHYGEPLADIAADGTVTDRRAQLPIVNSVLAFLLANNSALSAHNTDASAHEDIRALIAGLAASCGSGYDTAYIGGGAMSPSLTSGAMPSGVEDTSSALSRSVMLYGADADSSAEMSFPMPDNWDTAKPVKARLFWTAASGSAGDDIGFTLAGRAFANDSALDQALGTAVDLSDQLIAAGDMHVSAASAALTIAGSPAAGQMLRLKLTRDVSAGASPLAGDVQVLGLQIQYGTTGQQAAW